MITNRCTRGLTENPEAKQIRQTVFVEEQGFHNEFDAMDAEAWHVVLWKDEHAIATGRTFPAQGETHGCTETGRDCAATWRGFIYVIRPGACTRIL